MRYYVTLFDSNYLTRGLVMYRSLLRHAGNFHLWIVCFDDLTYKILGQLHLEKVTLVSLSQFEDEELLCIKPERTHVEYLWTCTPSVALYVLNNEPNVNAITYLDADLMFFSSPEPIFVEMGEASILITEHRYLPDFDQSASNGIFNVQFMMFRRSNEGLEALRWWRDRCIEWCFYRAENNRLGDQKYLDDWPVRFKGVHVLQHLGGGLAPWNSDRYSIHKVEKKVYVERYPLIFYHFHGLKLYPFQLSYLYPNYPISAKIRQWIYQPYLNQISAAYKEIHSIYPGFDLGFVDFTKLPMRPKNFYRFIKMTLKDIIQGRYYRYAS